MKRFLELTILLAIIFGLAQMALAVPTNNKLISPDSVTKNRAMVRVNYTLPCELDEGVTFVMMSDDTGDQTAAVGVVYSETTRNHCAAGTSKKFQAILDPAAYGMLGRGTSYVPLDVAK